MSIKDFRSTKMARTQALKRIKVIMAGPDPKLMFTGHAETEMLNDRLNTADVVNVLRASNSRITDEPEFKNGTYRYRVKTTNYCVVVSFTKNADGLVVVTVWQIDKL